MRPASFTSTSNTSRKCRSSKGGGTYSSPSIVRPAGFHMEIYADESDTSSINFLATVREACPVTIAKLLTDNGRQFTDRLTRTKRLPRIIRSQAASTCSTAFASDSTSSTALFPLAIRKRTVWWSASMAATARSSSRLVSPAAQSSNRRCAPI